MNGEKPYTASDIPEWEGRLASALAAHKIRVDAWAAMGGIGSAPFDEGELLRAKLTLSMLREGVSVAHLGDGVLLNGRIVVTPGARKWRWPKAAKWHDCDGEAEALVRARGGTVFKHSGEIPAMSLTRARLEGLCLAQGLVKAPFELPSDPVAAWGMVEAYGKEYERTKAEGGLPATRRQAKYVKDIAKRLRLKPPKPLTSRSAKSFIETHKAAFDAARAAAKLGLAATAATLPETKSEQAAPVAAPTPVAPEPAAPQAEAKTKGKAGRHGIPDYRGLRRVKPTAMLRIAGVADVDELVDRVNEVRAKAGRQYVSASHFPSGMAKFRRLAQEWMIACGLDPALLTAQPEPPPSLPGLDVTADAPLPDRAEPDGPAPVVEAGPAPVVPPEPAPSPAEIRREPYRLPYDAREPLIDFLHEAIRGFDIEEHVAVETRFSLAGPWNGMDALADALGVDARRAETILSDALERLDAETGCWEAIGRVIAPLLRHPPVSLDDLRAQPWAMGMGGSALLLSANLSAELSQVSVEGYGDCLVPMPDKVARKFAAVLTGQVRQFGTSSADVDGITLFMGAAFGMEHESMARRMATRLLGNRTDGEDGGTRIPPPHGRPPKAQGNGLNA